MNDLLKRTLHTAWQTFAVFFMAGLLDVFNAFQKGTSTGKIALVSLALSAAAAALSAVKSYVTQTK